MILLIWVFVSMVGMPLKYKVCCILPLLLTDFADLTFILGQARNWNNSVMDQYVTIRECSNPDTES